MTESRGVEDLLEVCWDKFACSCSARSVGVFCLVCLLRRKKTREEEEEAEEEEGVYNLMEVALPPSG